jgi:DNA adenine methylase
MFINSFISWIGGKKALRKVIYRLFPKDYGRYIEVFGGGGWVLAAAMSYSQAKATYCCHRRRLKHFFYQTCRQVDIFPQ